MKGTNYTIQFRLLGFLFESYSTIHSLSTARMIWSNLKDREDIDDIQVTHTNLDTGIVYPDDFEDGDSD